MVKINDFRIAILGKGQFDREKYENCSLETLRSIFKAQGSLK